MFIARIEGPEFHFTVRQAAGLSMFKRIVRAHECFHTLCDVASTKFGAKKILERIDFLASFDTKPQCENPYDIIMATYLLALDEVGSRHVKKATRRILSTQQLWWAKQVAQRILREIEGE